MTVWRMRIASWLNKTTHTHTHTQNMQSLLLLHCNSKYRKVTQCYVVHALRVLFNPKIVRCVILKLTLETNHKLLRNARTGFRSDDCSDGSHLVCDAWYPCT
jgi:hypothetical protein